MATPAAAESHREKRRERLRAFYNLDESPQKIKSHSASFEPSQTGVANPLDLPSFDATKYLNHLLKTSSVADLLNKDTTLCTEIKELRAEARAMVYDNYHKYLRTESALNDVSVSSLETASDAFHDVQKAVQNINSMFEKIHVDTAESREKYRAFQKQKLALKKVAVHSYSCLNLTWF